MFVFKLNKLKIANVFWPFKHNAEIILSAGTRPIIEWDCGKKKCCKKYRKAEKKRCKSCPKVN